MAEKIVKIHPIPSNINEDDIKHIFKDFKIDEISIRGDAAYIKFEEFGENESDMLDFTFGSKKYTAEGGWNADIQLLPLSEWDSSEEEVIEHKKEEQAEEIKVSGSHQSEFVSIPEDLTTDGPEVVSLKDNEKLQSSEVVHNNITETNTSNISQTNTQTPQTSKIQESEKVEEVTYKPPTYPSLVSVPQVLVEEKPLLSRKQQKSAVLPVGTVAQIEHSLYEAKEAILNEIKGLAGQSLPSWIWPLALVFTLLSLTMH